MTLMKELGFAGWKGHFTMFPSAEGVAPGGHWLLWCKVKNRRIHCVLYMLCDGRYTLTLDIFANKNYFIILYGNKYMYILVLQNIGLHSYINEEKMWCKIKDLAAVAKIFQMFNTNINDNFPKCNVLSHLHT